MKKITLILSVLISLNACQEDPEPDSGNSGKTPADFTVNWNKAWGTSLEDDFNGAVLDAGNNLIFTGVTEPDGYIANVFVCKTDGNSIAWAKSLDAGDQDFQPSWSGNGHATGGGGSRCIDIDPNGDVYITGASKQGFNEVFAVRYSNSGNMLWQMFWEANSSGLANGNAQAYAIDETNGKVFITGSTGAGVGTENSQIFLLVLDASNGSILSETQLGIDPSTSSNDMAYVVQSPDGNTVYLAGWEGQNNSGILLKFSGSGANFEWMERIDVGYGNRFNDMAIDTNGDIYLATDFRGVSTHLGVLKLNSNGDYLWGRKYQGAGNDRNNVSCLRLINGDVYVGGRGSHSQYDLSQFGDGLVLKADASGNLIKQYNFYTDHTGDKCGERIESILLTGNQLILAGETWPEFSAIDGNWYIPEGSWSSFNPNISKETACNIIASDGVLSPNSFTESNLNSNLYHPANGSQGSSDVQLFNVTLF